MELDLCGADLSNAQLALGNLTHWVLDNADLTNTVLYKRKVSPNMSLILLALILLVRPI